MLPGFKDGLSKLAFGATTWHKVAAINAVIHLISKDGRRYRETSL